VARLGHTPQKSLRHLVQETSISKLLIHEVNFDLFKWCRECVHVERQHFQ